MPLSAFSSAFEAVGYWPEKNGMPVTRAAYLKFVTLVVCGATMTTLYLWQKVELNHRTGKLSELHQIVTDLERERSRLTATVVRKKKSGVVKRIAEGQLGMSLPKGRMARLIVESYRPSEPQNRR